ncbi:hypothetical protein [Leisingera sp. M523]|uniref:hypothetical protein n=1 Tax=Leisingera sp. M523 TaxID=2867013 RepID=UPI0021A7EBF3|nr:hypothetical protein [Leisingera sp. M523]UWQ29804.1 hypothetical protein K3557_04420 [Leisingera sp. M523]
MIDDDVKRYPPELLFKWREVHDEFTASQLEKAGSWARLEVQKEFFDTHPNLTPAARRILADKPEFWEGLLTLELLRSAISDPKLKMADLLSGAYVPQFKTISNGHEATFFQRKFFELNKLIASSKQIFTAQLFTSWGEDGHSGDETAILHIGSLIQNLSNAFATWEEEVHSVFFEREVFLETNEVLKGCGNHNFKQIEKVQDLVAEVIQSVNTHEEARSLDFKHTMVFDFPSGFDDRFENALNFAKQELLFDEI